MESLYHLTCHRKYMQKGGAVNHHSSSTPQEYERQVTRLSEVLETFYTFQKKFKNNYSFIF